MNNQTPSNTHQPEPPKIEFPHKDYVIKVLGDAGPDYQDLVISTVKKFAPDVDENRLRTSTSKNGRFLSITLYFTATSEQQLHDLHNALKATGRVKMVI